jgi:tripartite-type tricarboxylate transporter receptor subunit TctC
MRITTCPPGLLPAPPENRKHALRCSLRRLFCIAGTAILAAQYVPGSNAFAQQKLPAQPVRIVVPYAPGGGADVMARVIAQKLSESMRQSVIVENRAGAGGMIGSEFVVRAAPDGHTFAFVSGAYTTAAALHNFPYDPVNDITAVIMVGEASSIAVVHLSVPIRSVKELISYAKAHPRKLNYGTGGTGGFSHLIVELFELMAGTRMTHIPYKGTGPALNDLLGGQLDVIFGSTPSTAPHVKSGKLRALGVTSKTRSSALPEVPPIAETVPGYYAPLLYGIWGPKGLPAEIVTLWNSEVAKVLQTQDMKNRLTLAGIEGTGGSPAEFREALKSDIQRWQKVVKAAKIQPSQ